MAALRPRGGALVRYGGVEAKELLDWADAYESGPELPRLVRKLILETSGKPAQLEFPAGKNLLYGGWDGRVISTSETAFIPEGESLWELSTSKRVPRKADQDYKKRSVPPAVPNPHDCTYVSLSLQKWEKKAEWAKKHKRDNIWRDVRAYDVHDIDEWLDSAPVSQAWISQELGFEPYGIRAAESWWNSWSRATSPPCLESLILAGRSKALEQLQKCLSSSRGITTIKGPSSDEVIAFIVASCREVISNRQEWETKLAIVDDIKAWRMLCEHRTSLMLIPQGLSLGDEVHSASNHYVIVPVLGAGEADIELPKLDQEEVAKELQQADVEEKTAEELGCVARRSLLALRRRLAIKAELQKPQWAMSPIPRTVRRCLLAGRWDDANDGDTKILAKIGGLDYEALREDLVGFSKVEDPFVCRVGSTWSLVSDYDAWLLLRGELEDNDITSFREAAVEVLEEKDPSLELPREEQMLAAVKGHVRKYSNHLRLGLAVSLALMGATGEAVRLPRGELLSDCALAVVYDLLKTANDDRSGLCWASLQDVLTILCEAAPDIYLDAIRTGVASEEPVLRGMFTDQDTDMFSVSSPHSSLLWSLEKLAWSKRYFGQVVDLLARLEEIDPGGRLSNRPYQSLSTIFSPLLPQTSVDVTGRLSAIDGLRSRHEEISRRLMLDLLPEPQGDIIMPTAEPEYRDWKTEEQRPTWKEYWLFIEALVERLLADAGQNHSRWIEIIKAYPCLAPTPKKRVVAGFSDYLAKGTPNEEARYELWEALREIIALHEEYAGAEWSMSESDLEPLATISDGLVPDDPCGRWAWLFDDQFPKIPGKSRIDESQSRYEESLQKVRDQAIDEILHHAGLDGVLSFGKKVQMSFVVGWTLANLAVTEGEDTVLELLKSSEEVNSNIAMGYSVRRFRLGGWEWLDPLLVSERVVQVTKAKLLVATSDFPKAWEKADQLGQETAKEFWRGFTPYGLGQHVEHAPYASRRLLGAGRPASALQLISIYTRKQSDPKQGQLFAEILEAFFSEEDLGAEGVSQLIRHDILAAFKYLQGLEDFDIERMAKLEWAYMHVLRFDGSPVTLHGFMAGSPQFFVDVVSSAYRPKHHDEEDVTSTDSTQRIAENAFQLLMTWRTIPGIIQDNLVDTVKLNGWIDEALNLLSEADRLEVGKTYIGHVLAWSPTDPDGSYPCEVVRDLLERLQSDKIEQGFCIEIRNRRGVTSRGLGDGGDQERTLAEKYKGQAEQYSNRWPRTAAIMRSLAESYEHEARSHDEDAERFQSGLDR